MTQSSSAPLPSGAAGAATGHPHSLSASAALQATGPRIRARRKDLGITQAALAEQVGVSASYLNLIEHSRRSIGGTLLLRIAAHLDTTVDALSGREEGRLAADLTELAADPVLSSSPLPVQDIPHLVGAAPDLARAAVTVYRAYLDARSQTETLAERLAQDPYLMETSHQLLTLITSIRSFSEILEDYGDIDEVQRQRFITAIADESQKLSGLTGQMFDFLEGRTSRRPRQSPEEEVDDLIHDHGNHFPAIERAAEQVRASLHPEHTALFAALAERLRDRHAITIRFCPEADLGGADSQFDPAERVLLLAESLPIASWRFHASRILGQEEAAAEIAAIAADPRLSSDAARDRARDAMTRAFAAALLLPYRPFLQAAREVRYDIERLQSRFGASFEQVCHRLTSLRVTEDDAIPFHLLRTDIAGNISKRFSASGLRLPRYSGTCPRWVSHTAFLTPDRVTTQLARLPDGSSWLFIARASSRSGGGYRAARTHHCVMVGCDASYARHMVYGDGLDVASAQTGDSVGISCRQCPRVDCRQRAMPMLRPDGGAA